MSVGRYFYNLASANKRLFNGLVPGMYQLVLFMGFTSLEVIPKEFFDVSGRVRKFFWSLHDLELIEDPQDIEDEAAIKLSKARRNPVRR
mmetsp:Transcript_4992/g.9403  ORF Transcript_4992/g.9403 Transcript_4992/m.9403 type:complete len:89 (+) Transcript_4992:715-981(+)